MTNMANFIYNIGFFRKILSEGFAEHATCKSFYVSLFKGQNEMYNLLQVWCHPMGLHHPLDGVTNPEYKLLRFKQLTNFFLQREEGTSF